MDTTDTMWTVRKDGQTAALTVEDLKHLLSQLVETGDLVVTDEETRRCASGPKIGMSLAEGRIHVSLRPEYGPRLGADGRTKGGDDES